MQGQGTKDNPYIVDNFQEFYNITCGDGKNEDNYIKIKEAYVWDMNEIDPNNELYYEFLAKEIDGNGVTIKNFYFKDDSREAVLDFSEVQTVKNLKFFEFSSKKKSGCLFRLPENFLNNSFSGIIVRNTKSKDYLSCFKVKDISSTVNQCSFNIDAFGPIKIFDLTAADSVVKNCEFILNVKDNLGLSSLSLDAIGTFKYCRFKGNSNNYFYSSLFHSCINETNLTLIGTKINCLQVKTTGTINYDKNDVMEVMKDNIGNEEEINKTAFCY